MLACGLTTMASAEDAAAESALDEAGLIDVLESDAGWLEKQAACRRLRQIGTVKCIAALAALLPDEELSHMARYALEPMPYRQAGQALCDALGKTEGTPKVGVIISIGARREPEAVALLVPLLEDTNVPIARAAAGALGRIATPEAAEALFDFRSAVPEAVRPALAEGLLAAGERLAVDGQGELAVSIYQDLSAPSWPMYLRVSALRGLAYAQPNQAPERLIEALGGNEALFRDVAAQVVSETSGADMTKRYADALPKLPAGGQAALLRGLADRGDRTARTAVAQAVLSPDKQVGLAAVKALGALGSAVDVAALTALLASDDAEIAYAARASLMSMQGEGMNSAVAAAVPDAAPAVRARLFEVLTSRRAEQAVPLAVKGLDDTDGSVRVAGLRVLAVLGGPAQAPVAVAAVAKAADSNERSVAEKALCAICSRGGDEVLPIVLDAMAGASAESRVVLLRALARIGGPKVFETILGSVKDADAQVGDEAVRQLSNWPTLDALPHLLDLARSDDLGRQVLGLRGYVRLARTEPSAEKKSGMLTQAMNLAKRPEEKKLVLAAWGTLPTGQSLDVLRPHLDDPAVRNEAASALVAVAAELGKKDEENKARARDALKAVIETCEDEGIRKSAQKALAGLK